MYEKSPTFRHLADKAHLYQISADYAAEWFAATTNEERIQIWDEYLRESRLAILHAFGIEITVATVMHVSMSDPVISGLILMAVVVVAWLIPRG